jgi:hypothetical protein
MRARARRAIAVRSPWRAYAKVLGALACCTVVALALFVPAALAFLRDIFGCMASFGCSPRPVSARDVAINLGLLSPLVVFPVGARVIRGLVHREIPGRSRQGLLLWGFALFPILAAMLALPSFKAYELAHYLFTTPERQRQEAKERQQEAYESAFRGARIQAEVLEARSIEESVDSGTLELTLRIQNLPLILPYCELDFHELGEREVPDRGVTSGPADSPYRIAHERHGEGGVLMVRNDGGRWSYLDYFTSQVLTSGPDTFTARIHYVKRRAGLLGPPRSVILRIAIRPRDDGVYRRDQIVFVGPLPFPPSP